MTDFLAGLDPGSRALLDLSLRQEISDEQIANLLQTDASQVGARRAELIDRAALALGEEEPADPAAAEEALRALPPERWRPGAPDRAEPPDERPLEPPPPAREPSEPSAGRTVLPEVAAGPGRDGRARLRGAALVALAVLMLGTAAGVVIGLAGDEDGSENASAPAPPRGEAPGDTGAGGPPGAGAPPGTGETRPPRTGRPPRTERPRRRRPRPRPPEREPAGTRLRPLPGVGSGASGTIRLIGGGQDRLSVSLRGLPPRGAFYEVWLYRSVTDAVSLGRAGRSSRRLQVSLPARAADYPFIDVSLERPDGNRSHSGQSVLRARLR